ncbi:hypothetical protein K144316041_p21700 (plasmid) [Clostridium tetani]|nr:hypothetical protein [Clostridium tetani]BDR74331.1 hypothetical protein K144316041_p21700 [Clostridium tetani]
MLNKRMVKVTFKNGLTKVLYAKYFQNIVLRILKDKVFTYKYL